MVNVCQTCGDEGFVEALVYCDSCKIESVHRYCLGITPVPFLDYITWFCEDCEDCDESDSGSDCNVVDHNGEVTHILKKTEKKKKKEKKKSSNDTLPILADEDHGLQDAMDVEPVKLSSSSPIQETMETKRRDSLDCGKSRELTGLVGNGSSLSEAGTSSVLDHNSCTSKERKLRSVEKKTKKSSNHTQPVLVFEDHGLQDAMDVEPFNLSSSPIKETMNKSKRRESLDSEQLHELTGLERNGASVLEAENGASILKDSEIKKKKKKKKKKSSNHTQTDVAVEDQELQDATNVEHVKVSSAHVKETTKESKRKESSDSGKPRELTGLVRNGASVLDSRNSYSVPDHNSDTSKKRKLSSVEKKKKKKKKSSNDTPPVLADEGLQDAMDVVSVNVSSSPIKETTKESTRRDSSDSEKPHVLTDLVRSRASVSETGNGASVLEKRDKKKKKKKKKSTNDTPPDLAVEDNGLQDATNIEPVKVSSSPIKETMKESKRRESSDIGKLHKLTGVVGNGESHLEAGNGEPILEKSEKKKKKKRKSRSQTTPPVLAVEEHGLKEATNVVPVKVPSSSLIKETIKESKRQERSDSRKPHESTDLVKNGASVSEAGNSSSVPYHNSCTSEKRKLSSDDKPVTSEIRKSAAENNSCKEVESNMLQTSEGLTARHFNTQTLDECRAKPIFQPIWRGSISIKGGNICSSIDGLVVHISSLACPMVHETASSLHACLSAEMFPRLEIWPLKSFLKNGGPNDGNIALYFFPSAKSNDEKVFYSLILEMKKNDLAMRCVLDNAELLLFTSYMLPTDYWFFHSKEYLWGIFRRRQTSQH